MLKARQCFVFFEKTLNNNATGASYETIRNALAGFYVDDGLFSFMSESELIKFYDEIVPLLKSKGFPLTKFFPNNEKLKSLFPAEDLVPIKSFNFETESAYQNILGMVWNASSDCFQFI